MKYILLSLLQVFFSQLILGQINNVTINFPDKNVVDTGLLSVKAIVVPGDYEITSVVATVENRTGTLLYNAQSGYFEGNVSLTGLTIGNTYVLSVTATDIMNSQRTDTMQIIIDPPPSVNIQLPVNNEVATPKLQIKASAVDNLNCNIIVRVGLNDYVNNWMDRQIFKDTFVNSLDTVIDLSSSWSEGTSGYITYTVIDSRGQQVNASRKISVESSPYLERVFSTVGIINDFNYGKLLSYCNDVSDGNSNGKLANINTTVIAEIPSPVSVYSALTPTGAIFMSEAGINGVLADWSNDSLYILGPSGQTSSFDVAGPYAIWSSGLSGKELNLRNTSAHTNTLISTTAANSENDVTADGVVAYWTNDGAGHYNIYRYVNGASITVTTDGNSMKPLTDGKLIVYSRNAAIYLYANATYIPISSTAGSPNDDYRVINGLVAYTKAGTSGQKQIWLRDTSGLSTQVTFFSNSSIIGGLGPDGSICFSRNMVNSPRYLYDKSSNKLKAIGTTLGKTYYRDSAWYVSIGRVLFKVKPDYLHNYYTVKQGNWSDPATWYGNEVPPIGADISLRSNVVVDVNATCNSLTVQNNAALTVNPGINLTILH